MLALKELGGNKLTLPKVEKAAARQAAAKAKAEAEAKAKAAAKAKAKVAAKARVQAKAKKVAAEAKAEKAAAEAKAEKAQVTRTLARALALACEVVRRASVSPRRLRAKEAAYLLSIVVLSIAG